MGHVREPFRDTMHHYIYGFYIYNYRPTTITHTEMRSVYMRTANRIWSQREHQPGVTPWEGL